MRFDNVLEWFCGKSRETISVFTIPALVESAEQGCWKRGVAVKARASLNKQNVAAKWAREVSKKLKVNYKHPLNDGLMNMRYGSYDLAPRTQHNKSRFFQSNNHMQCQACGHAIQNPFNWVPILAYGHSDNSTPCSLWVGRDCAEKLFGCKVEGDAIYPERQH